MLARSLKLNKTAAAVRAGLLTTTAMFALAGANAAFAQTCTPAAPAAGGTTTCSGVFTDSVNNHFTDAVDLTVIIAAGTTVDPAVGTVGLDASFTGDATVVSYGTFTVYDADAIYVSATDVATAEIYGSIYNYALNSDDNAVDVVGADGAYVTLGGSASTYSNDFDAYTVLVDSTFADSYVHVTDTGVIDAYSVDADAQAIGAYAYFDVTVVNDGAITASGGDDAWGIYEDSDFGAAYLYNNGTIDVSAYDYANGAGVWGETYGYAYNAGSVSATSTGYEGGAVGIAVGGDYADMVNAGDIYAAALDYGYATGAYVYGDTEASLVNYGYIGAYAYGGYATGAYVGSAGDVYVYNGDEIFASQGSFGDATGLEVYAGDDATIVNAGYIGAYAYYGTALGVDSYGADTSTLANTGDIYASVYVGTAVGAVSSGGNYGTIVNEGYIGAYAYYGASYGAYAYGGGGAYIINYGDIAAHTYAGTAVGAEAVSATYAEIYNDGSIYAYAYYGSAIGAEVISGGTATVINNGDIEGYGVIGYGIGVYLDVVDSAYILNNGTITGHAYPGYGYGYSIYSVGTSDDTVVNYGELNGSISLGYGDDSIWNYGDINLGDGEFIDMGPSDVAGGNYIYNDGTINFTGSNAIYTSGGTMYNSGILNMQDGDATTYVYFEGNLAGDGQLNVEIDGQAGTNDYMYIYGNVDADSDTTINVDLLSLPTAQSTVYDLVGVSGDSGSGNFQLGSVDFADNNFLDIEFTLIADVDLTNATPDVYSLGIEVLGLSDPGTLAASVPGSNLAMIHTMVGTWRQRMGVIDSYRAHSLSLWARVFTSKGDFSPEHVADGFGQGGNFDWHQQTTGIEAGVDFAVTDNLSLGLVLAQMEADTDLNDAGVGDNEVEADSYGVYATWISGGWYLDASYRWTDFENRLSSIAGAMDAATDGETFNIEAGYAWTTGSGLKIEPQIQWTHTKIEAIDVLVGDISNFAQDDLDSSRGRIGLSFRKDFGDPDVGWMWTPYSTLSAVREFDGEARYYITDDFTGYTSMEGTSAMLELGFNARTGNVAVYGGLTWMDGGAYESHFGGHLGVRYTFGGEAPAPAPIPAPVQKTCAELDDDGDGVNNCDDRCPGSTAGSPVGADGCPVPPAPEPEPVMEPKPYRG